MLAGFFNVADTETTGFDVVASYRHEGWSLSVAYNSTDTDIVNNPRVIMGIEEATRPAPEDKLILTGSETISALVRATRFGETERIFDFGGGFEPAGLWRRMVCRCRSINDHWSISAGGNNLLDEYPDLSIFDISYFGNLPYDVLSPIGVNGRFVYVRTNFSY